MKNNSFKLYNEELEWCLKQRSGSLRAVTILSAILEAQVTWLAQGFMRSQKFQYKPNENSEYYFYTKVLQDNQVLDGDKITTLKKFREQRKLILHNLFKNKEDGRETLNASIAIAFQNGKNLVTYLDKRLMYLITPNDL